MFVKMYLLGKSENIFRSKSGDNDRVWPHPAIEHWWIIIIAQAGLLPASPLFLTLRLPGAGKTPVSSYYTLQTT